MILGSYGKQICLCDWRYRKNREAIDQRISSFLNADYQEGDAEAIDDLMAQLSDYFSGKLKVFDIPLMLCGSEFQQSVWNVLLQIPFGETISYQELTMQLGSPKAIRAVASANGANAISVIVPCHRVIGSDGSLTGYAGGLKAKEGLLVLEGKADQLSLF